MSCSVNDVHIKRPQGIFSRVIDDQKVSLEGCESWSRSISKIGTTLDTRLMKTVRLREIKVELASGILLYVLHIGQLRLARS